jgi:hypothetical protein
LATLKRHLKVLILKKASKIINYDN